MVLRIRFLIVVLFCQTISTTVTAFAAEPEPVPPRIIKMEPANWATEVDPQKVDQLHVTFDCDMNTKSCSWCNIGGRENYPKTTAKPKWIDKRTCVLPVALELEKRYELSINLLGFSNFRSTEGVPVEPTRYTFYTVGSPEIKRSEQRDGTTVVFFRDDHQSPAIIDGSREQRWKADLTWLRNTLAAKHKNLFFKISRKDFYNRMNALIDSIPDTDDRALMSELIKIIKSIGDSHVFFSQKNGIFYPVSFFLFEDGVFVSGIDARFAEYYGQKLTAVEGIPIEQVLKRLQPFINHDNAYYEKNALAQVLRNARTLYYAGIAESPTRIRYTFGDKDWTVSYAELAGNSAGGWLPTPEQRLLSQRNGNKNYWFERLDNDVLYIKYNACVDMKDYSIAAFITDVFKEIGENDVTKVIVDLRNNGGGNSFLFDPFISKIQNYPKLNTSKNFKVIMGRGSFSAAFDTAWFMKAKTKAALVGEPTGAKPNHYGQIERLYLSNIDVASSYSTKHFKRVPGDPDALYPGTVIKLRAEEWFRGEDAFLKAALR